MTSPLARLYLASQSPRRAELLAQIALEFERVLVEVDETPRRGELPEDYVLRVASAKARAGLVKVKGGELSPLPVLGADTAVICDGQIMGKPRDKKNGTAMLDTLSDKTHQVLTAICYCYGDQEWTAISATDVTFRSISVSEINEYWETGEPRDKAGAYAIQGVGAIFITDIKGSYSAVVGLPLLETSQILQTIEKLRPYE